MVTKPNNLTLVQAPAGSGKTTKIEKDLIEKSREQGFSKKVLCITFTNRAAKELQMRIENQMIDISTIHSFFSKFMKNHLKEDFIIETFYNTYQDKIESEFDEIKSIEINNNEQEMDNYKYKKWVEFESSHGQVSNSVELKNIWSKTGLKYNERTWSNYLFGELSHDDLLEFTKICFMKTRKLGIRLISQYEEIIIDEYQDTNSSVIEVFYHATKDTSTCFKLIGDEMQNIYSAAHLNINYILDEFTVDKSMTINYRSPDEIVKILNEIYNDASIIQNSYKGEIGITPQLFVSNDIVRFSSNYPEHLLLVPSIKEAFSFAPELHEKYKDFPGYGYNNAKNIKLTDVINFVKSVDSLMEILNQSSEMIEHYVDKEYALAMSIYMKQKEDRPEISKRKIIQDFKSLSEFNINEDKSIYDFIDFLYSLSLWKNEISNIINEDKYQDIFELPYSNYSKGKNNFMKTSTQHGVKGESHNKVLVYLKDNKQVGAYMHDFLKIWSLDKSLNLDTFNHLLDKLKNCPIPEEIKEIERRNDKLDKKWHNQNKDYLEEKITLFREKYEDEKIINILSFDILEDYLKKPGISRYKKLLIGKSLERRISNVAMTYKLFYVVLSRAQEELIVVLDEGLCTREVISRFGEIGFQIP